MISRVGSYLSQSVYSVATPFHPFGGAVDIIVVQQQDGSFRSTPWYVRFGKFQGVLKGAEKIVKIEVNGVEADFHMYLDNSGEAYFIKEIDPEKDSDVNDSESLLESRKDDFGPEKNNNVDIQFQEDHAESIESDGEKRFYEFQGEQSSLLQVGNESEGVENVESIKVEVKSVESSKLEVETESTGVNVNSLDIEHKVSDVEIVKDHDGEEFERGENSPYGPEHEDGTEEPQPYYDDNDKFDGSRRTRIEISLCGNLLRPGMGSSTASETFNAHRISEEEFKISAASIIKNDSLIIKVEDKYFTWDKVAHIVLGTAAYGLEMHVDPNDAIPVDWNEETSLASTPSGRRWWLWPIAFRRVKTLDHNNSNLSGEDVFLDSESVFDSPQSVEKSPQSPQKQLVRTQIPTSEQISSLKLKDGQNMVSFVFSTRVLGVQKVDAHIYLWKWNARIVISDVDGTITKSDVLGQFMPLVGRDWSQSGVAQLFSAIKENGYQLLFLSARAIVQAYITRNFLINLKQDGKALPNGPVVISPDGLFPSLYREVIRRAPHEFKIACLEDIRALFPADYNPFYAGFGNRDTDELSYRKIGIPKGKIFIINPKGEVAISHRIDMKGKSYTSLHTLVNDMFPPTSMVEQEDYNSWNYWKVPLPDVDL
ncbi:putative phosphatidate phosphatase [Helianthus debilis subsp. tardiflorus]